MVCPPVHGDNHEAKASGLSPIQVGSHGTTIFFSTYISLDFAHYEIVSGINIYYCHKVKNIFLYDPYFRSNENNLSFGFNSTCTLVF